MAAAISYSHIKDVSPALLLSCLAAPSQRARGSWHLLQVIHDLQHKDATAAVPGRGSSPAETVSYETGKGPEEQQALHHQQPLSAEGQAARACIYVKKSNFTQEMSIRGSHLPRAPPPAGPRGARLCPLQCPSPQCHCPLPPRSPPCSPGLCRSRRGSREPFTRALMELNLDSSTEALPSCDSGSHPR